MAGDRGGSLGCDSADARLHWIRCFLSLSSFKLVVEDLAISGAPRCYFAAICHAEAGDRGAETGTEDSRAEAQGRGEDQLGEAVTFLTPRRFFVLACLKNPIIPSLRGTGPAALAERLRRTWRPQTMAG